MFNKRKGKFMVLVLVMTLLATAMISVFASCGAEPTLTEVQMLMPAEKTLYVIGEKFDTTGLVITGVYSDGTRKEITDYKIDKTGPLTAEDKEITITYGDYTFKQEISVVSAGDKPIITLAEGVNFCYLNADGSVKIAGGVPSNLEKEDTKWSWDGETLEIWLTKFIDMNHKEDHMSKMEIKYDAQKNITFVYQKRARWTLTYFCAYRDWSQVLTPDARYPDPNLS